jgi:hypothetical protein
MLLAKTRYRGWPNGARDKRNPDLDDAVASDDQGVECNGILRIPLHRVVGRRELRSNARTDSMKSRAPLGEQGEPREPIAQRP